MERRELVLAAAADPGQVFAALSVRYVVHAGPTTVSHWTCLDTADWRLHRAGMTLRDARQGRQAELVLSDVAAGRLAVPARAHSWPARVTALDESALRERIEPVVGTRALLPLAEVQVRSIPLELRDELDKTRVRVRVDLQRLTGGRPVPLPLRVLVTPLRGYGRDAERCIGLLTDALRPADATGPAATVAMTAAGHRPGEPTVPQLPLEGAAPAVDSLAALLARLADAVDAALPGVLDDLDTDYLRELRAAAEASSAVLRTAGELMPGAQAEHFAAEFGRLTDITTALADLDALLDVVGDAGCADLHADLAPLVELLTGRRRAALRAVRAELRSERVGALTTRWRPVLQGLRAPDVPGPTTRDAAARGVAETVSQLLAATAGVSAEGPAAGLEALARPASVAAELLTAYRTVLPEDERRRLTDAVGPLARSLTAVGTAERQRALLAALADTLARRDPPRAAPLLAVGALRERILRAQDAARAGLGRDLRRATRPATRAAAERLAGGRP